MKLIPRRKKSKDKIWRQGSLRWICGNNTEQWMQWTFQLLTRNLIFRHRESNDKKKKGKKKIIGAQFFNIFGLNGKQEIEIKYNVDWNELCEHDKRTSVDFTDHSIKIIKMQLENGIYSLIDKIFTPHPHS